MRPYINISLSRRFIYRGGSIQSTHYEKTEEFTWDVPKGDKVFELERRDDRTKRREGGAKKGKS